MRFIGFSVLAAPLFWMPSISDAACQHSTADYDLPAQRMGERLQQVAHTSGCPVEADLSSRQSARRVPALKGSYQPEDALRRTVKGSGFQVQATADGYVLKPISARAAGRKTGS